MEGNHHKHVHSGPLPRKAVSRTGAWVSLVCAIHCMAMPFVAALLPSLSAALHGNEWLEFGLIAAGFGLGVYSLVRGYGQHKRVLPSIIMIPALALVGAELADLSGGMHILLPIGAGLAAISQFLNFRYSTQVATCEC